MVSIAQLLQWHLHVAGAWFRHPLVGKSLCFDCLQKSPLMGYLLAIKISTCFFSFVQSWRTPQLKRKECLAASGKEDSRNILGWKEPTRISNPTLKWMAHTGIDPTTSALLGPCPNQLRLCPIWYIIINSESNFSSLFIFSSTYLPKFLIESCKNRMIWHPE